MFKRKYRRATLQRHGQTQTLEPVKILDFVPKNEESVIAVLAYERNGTVFTIDLNDSGVDLRLKD